MLKLKVLYLLIFLTMVVVTVSASLKENILLIPPAVINDVWFTATLFDAYFAFLSFYLWVCYKEHSWRARIIWFFAIALLGNLAMAVYMLIKLVQLPKGATVQDLLLRKAA